MSEGENCNTGPFGWLKKKLKKLRNETPELFAFVVGCTAGAILLAGTAIVRANCDGEAPKFSLDAFRPKKKKNSPKIKVTVQEGETLGDIVVKYVGDYTEDNIKSIKKLNRKIKDIDLLQVGQEIEVYDNREIEVVPEPVPEPPKPEPVKVETKKPEKKKKAEKIKKPEKKKKKAEKEAAKSDLKSDLKKKKGGWFTKKEKKQSEPAPEPSKKGKKAKKVSKLPQDKW